MLKLDWLKRTPNSKMQSRCRETKTKAKQFRNLPKKSDLQPLKLKADAQNFDS